MGGLFGGGGKPPRWPKIFKKRSGNPRLQNRLAGVVPSAARPATFERTVHPLSRLLGTPRCRGGLCDREPWRPATAAEGPGKAWGGSAAHACPSARTAGASRAG